MENTKYAVDFGESVEIFTESEIKYVFRNVIDHNEYATFDDWLWDMQRCGLVKAKED